MFREDLISNMRDGQRMRSAWFSQSGVYYELSLRRNSNGYAEQRFLSQNNNEILMNIPMDSQAVNLARPRHQYNEKDLVFNLRINAASHCFKSINGAIIMQKSMQKTMVSFKSS